MKRINLGLKGKSYEYTRLLFFALDLFLVDDPDVGRLMRLAGIARGKAASYKGL